jgi:hypothetical protein
MSAYNPNHRHGISNDDPEAADKLREKIAELEAASERMRLANICVRKNNLDGLLKLDYTHEEAGQLMRPDFAGRRGYPSYALANNNSNCRRYKERLASIEAKAARIDAVEDIGLVTVEMAPADNRVRVRFPEKPPSNVIGALKTAGFRWAPSEGAWQRQYSDAAIRYARLIASAMVPEE